MRRTYIVTGADGFIGSHLVEKLLDEEGASVIAVALYQADGSIGWLNKIQQQPGLFVLRGDIRDPMFLRRCYQAAPKDSSVIFYNLAALVSVPKSIEMPHFYWETNATAVLTILSTLWGAIDQFIQVSTSEVFDGETGPYEPGSPLCPVSPYGASKAAAEMICRGWRGTTNDKIKVVRIFNTFGPRQYPRAIIPKMLREALKMRGLPYHQPRFGDGSSMRSFIPVHKTCEALVKAANIQTGVLQYTGGAHPISISGLWKFITRVVGVDGNQAIWMSSEHMRGGIEVPCLQGVSSPEFEFIDMKEPLKETEAALEAMMRWMETHPSYCSEADYQ